MEEYKHIVVIIKDEAFQIQANLHEKPIKLSETHPSIMDWQSKHEYFPFASKEDENKVYDFISNSWYKINPIKNIVDCLKQGIEVDCIDIKDNLSHNGRISFGKVAFFKQPNEVKRDVANQTELAGEIIALVKNHKGSGNALFSILTKYTIIKR